MAALIWACLTLMAPALASAENIVLIQGYLGGSENWRDSGITAVLKKHGWESGGHLYVRREGIAVRDVEALGIKRFFTLDLTTEAPLMYQLKQLERYLDYLRRRHPGSAQILIGHSAGGVLGRLYMVRHPKAEVAGLITIASPHRGTESAEIGLMAGQSPLSWMGSMLGINTLNRSQGLYHDLMRENPNNLLGWLNYQQHPPAMYVSVVRSLDDETFGFGDMVVPSWSQDMNQVYALRGRARTITVQGTHGLRSEDGQLLIRILKELQRT
jgi:pimeloyl-ACP methyl ester carboxylesterase